MEHQKSGFTLIELLISVVILVIVVAGMMDAFSVQARMHQIVSDVSESHQKLSLFVDLIEKDIRNASYMMSEAAAVCGVDNTNAPDILYVSDAYALSAIDEIAALETEGKNPYIASKGAGGPGMGVTVVSMTATTIQLNDGAILDTAASYDNTGDGVNDTDFQYIDLGKTKIAGGVIMFDTKDPSKGVACGTIQGITGSTLTIDWKATIAPAAFPSDMMVIPAHVYEVGKFVAGTNATQLRRDGLIVASDIEDLQVSYLFDIDDDGLADAGEIRGDYGVASYDPSDGSLAGTLRDVKVELSVVTPFEGGDVINLKGRPQDIANHDVSSTKPPADGFRRRLISMVVRPRNIGVE